MGKWYPQDIVKTKASADRMATYHRGKGLKARIRKVRAPEMKNGKIVHRVRYYVDVATN